MVIKYEIITDPETKIEKGFQFAVKGNKAMYRVRWVGTKTLLSFCGDSMAIFNNHVFYRPKIKKVIG